MPTVLIQFETGDFELLATTIKAWLERLWAGTLPATNKLPSFVDPSERKDKTAWPSNKNKKAIYVNAGRKTTMPGSNSSDGSSVITMVEDVRIDVFGPSQTDIDQFTEKINNIIIGARINGTNRVLKSDAVETSKITQFREHQIDWGDPFTGETAGKKTYVHTFGYLGCQYMKALA